jgi:spoIIIJ-associated protein
MDRTDTLEFVKKYFEDTVAFLGLNLDIEVDVEDGIIIAVIPSSDQNSLLIGRGAENLRSLQYLLSTTLRNNGAELTRVNIDIAGYKKQHSEKMTEKAKGWIEEVRNSGEPKVLDLNSADRWIVHNVAGEYSDITTHSEGEGRDRRLIISQKSS